MKLTIFQKTVTPAVLLHALVFIAIYFGAFAEVGGTF